jgi:hypothetical protein
MNHNTKFCPYGNKPETEVPLSAAAKGTKHMRRKLTGTIVFPSVILLQEPAVPQPLIRLPALEFTEFRRKQTQISSKKKKS